MAVGFTVGFGVNEGLIVGVAVGFGVVTSVGFGVGALVGFGVGFSVGIGVCVALNGVAVASGEDCSGVLAASDGAAVSSS